MYSRQLEDRTLTLVPSGWTYDSTFVLYDRETESLWYPDENSLRAISGPLFGKRLPELPSKDTSWSRWSTEHAESKILE